MGLAVSFKDVTFTEAMGALAVVIAVIAYAIYVWQSLRGKARPHPLSWLIFGILTGTAYLVQLDEAAGPGSWVMAITTAKTPMPSAPVMRARFLCTRRSLSRPG